VVGPGDRVAVRGCLERTPSAESTGYRESEMTWVLRPHGERTALELAARRPAAAVLRMSRIGLGLALGTVALTSWIVMKSAGSSWLDRCWDLEPRTTPDGIADEPLEITNTHACALAAAMPDSRSRALSGLRRLLEKDLYVDERSVRRLTGATELDDGCVAAAEVLLTRARFEEAAIQARACGDLRTEYAALVAQGRFEEAARIHTPAEEIRPELPHISTLIAAGAWTEAAQRAQQQAAVLASKPPDPDSVAPWMVRRLRCLAEALRSFGGDRDAERRLRALDTEEPGMCATAIAAIASPAERRRMLERVAEDPFESPRQLRQMMWAAGLDKSWIELDSDGAHVLATADDFGGARIAYLAWLVAMERGDRPDLDPRYRATLLRWRAVAEVLDDQAEAAVATAREALALLDALPPDEFRPHYMRLLPAMARLHTPAIALGAEIDLEAAHRTDPRGMDLYFSRLMLRAGLATERHRLSDSAYHEVLVAAQQGEGRPLARHLGKQPAHWRDGDILAVLPRIRTGREAVGRQLAFAPRYFYQRFTYEPAMPWEHAFHAATQREGMELAGMPEEAARWAAIYRRLDAVLTDRQRLLALILWED
jgi:hypothetical protein